MKKLLLPAWAILVLITSCAPAKQLRQAGSFQPGYSEKLRQTVETETTLTMFGTTQNQISGNTSEYEYHVTELLPSNRVKWEMNITRYVLHSTDAEDNEIVYDTSDPNRDTSNKRMQVFDGMINQPMYMVTTNTGTLLEFSGATALFEKMMEPYKDQPEMQALATTLKANFNDDAMKETVKNMWGFLPEKPVRVGQSWKETRNKAGILDMKTDYSYKLASRNAEEAVIKAKSKSGPLPGKPTIMDMGVMKIRYDLTGTGNGTIRISQPHGTLKTSEFNVKMEGTMHLDNPDMPKMDVPIKTNTRVTTELIK